MYLLKKTLLLDYFCFFHSMLRPLIEHSYIDVVLHEVAMSLARPICFVNPSYPELVSRDLAMSLALPIQSTFSYNYFSERRVRFYCLLCVLDLVLEFSLPVSTDGSLKVLIHLLHSGSTPIITSAPLIEVTSSL